MSDHFFDKGVYAVPLDEKQVRSDWSAQGFSFGIFRDPPGREWNDFVHESDEYVVVAEGELEITVGGEMRRTVAGDRVRIPAGVSHSLRTVSSSGSIWFYGYGRWERES
jgi:quercetin dioxygenase-like cupin family protein